jgi:outer membrane protein OmpA-like peptidoglycan-associated protein
MATGFDSTQVPVVPEIYFAPFSDTVAAEYVDSKGPLPSILPILAERLLLNSNVTLSITGYADPMSGEREASLAESRARRVAAEIEALGVPSGSLQIEPGKVRPDPTRIPPDPTDAKWIEEQNRSVGFSVPQTDQEERIFGPITVAVDTTLRDSVAFDLDVFSPAGSETWLIKAEPRAVEISSDRPTGKDLRGPVTWNGTDKNGMLVSRNRWYRYQFLLTDSLGRPFRTRMDSVYLAEKRTIRRREIFGAAQFGKVEPVYSFYWDHLMDIAREMMDNPSMRLRFEGHACAIGSFAVNERLSLARAQRITEAFLERVKQQYPAKYEGIRNRIDPSIGYGERDPLRIKLRGQGETLLGDNDHPVGRYYNRRIMVLLYREN